jgi:3-isopropylmalate/(R)-2-methylmalate dehydratase large subunit
MAESRPRTLFDKIWDSHVVERLPDGTCLLYIDRHLVHEVTSPQAFEGLRLAGRRVRRPEATFAVADHNVPTSDRSAGIAEPESRLQVETLERNVAEFGVRYFPLLDRRQGIVHIVGPEQGISQPGMTIVCGDSHTSTHGALGALAFGIGTSEVEHVLATQTLLQKPAKNMLVRVDGALPFGCTAKDIILAIIGRIGTAGGTGHVIEYSGEAIRSLDMAGRMTVCNMSIEAGARAGLIAPDETTFAYLKGRPFAPSGEAWERALAWWKTLPSDPGAAYDRTVVLDAAEIVPLVTWGTSPEDVVPITGTVPDPEAEPTEARRSAKRRMLDYMASPPARGCRTSPSTWCSSAPAPTAGIGGHTRCRCGRAGAEGGAGRARDGGARVGPCEGSRRGGGARPVLIEAGFEWREAGCSMCLGYEPRPAETRPALRLDLQPQLRRQAGPGRADAPDEPGHAAAAAVTGRLTDVRELAR